MSAADILQCVACSNRAIYLRERESFHFLSLSISLSRSVVYMAMHLARGPVSRDNDGIPCVIRLGCGRVFAHKREINRFCLAIEGPMAEHLVIYMVDVLFGSIHIHALMSGIRSSISCTTQSTHFCASFIIDQSNRWMDGSINLMQKLSICRHINIAVHTFICHTKYRDKHLASLSSPSTSSL